MTSFRKHYYALGLAEIRFR